MMTIYKALWHQIEKCSHKIPMSTSARNTTVILSYLINLILSIHKQESPAFETIQACEIAHRVQPSHPFALRGAFEVEAGLPKAIQATWRNKNWKWIFSQDVWCNHSILPLNGQNLSTWSSYGCPAENGMHGIPFSGCFSKLNGLLSTIAIRDRSLDKHDRSFTCSRYSLSVHKCQI